MTIYGRGNTQFPASGYIEQGQAYMQRPTLPPLSQILIPPPPTPPLSLPSISAILGESPIHSLIFPESAKPNTFPQQERKAAAKRPRTPEDDSEQLSEQVEKKQRHSNQETARPNMSAYVKEISRADLEAAAGTSAISEAQKKEADAKRKKELAMLVEKLKNKLSHSSTEANPEKAKKNGRSAQSTQTSARRKSSRPKKKATEKPNPSSSIVRVTSGPEKVLVEIDNAGDAEQPVQASTLRRSNRLGQRATRSNPSDGFVRVTSTPSGTIVEIDRAKSAVQPKPVPISIPNSPDVADGFSLKTPESFAPLHAAGEYSAEFSLETPENIAKKLEPKKKKQPHPAQAYQQSFSHFVSARNPKKDAFSAFTEVNGAGWKEKKTPDLAAQRYQNSFLGFAAPWKVEGKK